MLLISLMLAAAPQPAVKPDSVQRREPARERPARSVKRSKRLAELEAAVASLPDADPGQGRQSGPEGL